MTDKKKYKTTKAHFTHYQKRCAYWVTFFGLLSYEVFFTHKLLGPDEDANVEWNLEGRNVTFRLSKEVSVIPTNKFLDRCAFHEVCHLFIGRLEDLCREGRMDSIDEEIHCIIRTLENVLLES